MKFFYSFSLLDYIPELIMGSVSGLLFLISIIFFIRLLKTGKQNKKYENEILTRHKELSEERFKTDKLRTAYNYSDAKNIELARDKAKLVEENRNILSEIEELKIILQNRNESLIEKGKKLEWEKKKVTELEDINKKLGDKIQIISLKKQEKKKKK